MLNDPLESALIAHRARDYPTARRIYQQVLGRYPESDQAHYLLGMLFLETNEPDQARIHLLESLRISPENASYLSTFADALCASGKSMEALPIYEKSLRLGHPDHQAVARLNYGATLMDLGRVQDAIAQFTILTQAFPQFVAAWNNLGNALLESGQSEMAIKIFETALKMAPDTCELHSNLSKANLEMGLIEPAARHAESAVRLKPNSAAAWMHLGQARVESGDLEAAKDAFVKCLKIAPQSAAVYANLGRISDQQGDLQSAIANWLECLRIEPLHAGVLGRLATRLGAETPPELQSRMEQVIGNTAVSDKDHEMIGYGLAHLHDKKSNFELAARYLDQACAVREKQLEKAGRLYQAAKFTSFVNHCLGMTRGTNCSHIGQDQASAQNAPEMVFVVGMARSGTSLVEQVMATHPEITGAGELTWLPDIYDSFLVRQNANKNDQAVLTRQDIVAMRNQYFERLQQNSWSTKYIIDKLPDNLFYIGLIEQLFPESKVIICQRNALDIALSCRMTRFATVRWNSSWANLTHRLEMNGMITRMWLADCSKSVMELHYEDLVKDLSKTISAVFDRLGLETPTQVESFYETRRTVNTASSAQVRKPLYASSIGRWRHYDSVYGTYFREIQRRCQMKSSA